jgi:hypothetical protein
MKNQQPVFATLTRWVCTHETKGQMRFLCNDIEKARATAATYWRVETESVLCKYDGAISVNLSALEAA